MQEGLPRRTALEALTVNPASFLGLDDRVGAPPGLDGDIVVWSGDPSTSLPAQSFVVVDGREVHRWRDGLGA
ncbi:glucuronate isomerase [Leifsonia xyli subsp. cynodontis DSM 46306]|uniref:Amidohydrolase 3 domain-containing protein n=1 Tax=Leifsonia xyli subsp. cynodontis DSM 46306 TaxID=1389489 RepID=U3PD95_LEIXC|nr:amidohydrolase family protein [Leifsonia xyli]AGW41498.1 glucuronate isomerase [Leifsonia xyli subsp. cynodontis DSM 46306]